MGQPDNVEITKQLTNQIDTLQLEAAARTLEDAFYQMAPNEWLAEFENIAATLGKLGYGPITDIVSLASKTKDHAPSPHLICATVEKLHSIGATAYSNELLKLARDKWPDEELLAYSEQRTHSERRWYLESDWDEVACALYEGNRNKAEQLAKTFVTKHNSEQPNKAIIPLMNLLANMAEERNEFDLAISWYGKIRELFPSSDWGAIALLKMGLNAWARGQWDESQKHLDKLRELSRNRPLAFFSELHSKSSELSKEMGILRDQSSKYETRWSTIPIPRNRRSTLSVDFRYGNSSGIHMLSLIYSVFPKLKSEPIHGKHIPNIAVLKWHLQSADGALDRCFWDETIIKHVIDNGGMLIIPEERPVDTGFLWINGIENNTHLLKLVDGSLAGSIFRTINQQRNRSNLFGQNALIVWGCGNEGRERQKRAWETMTKVDTHLDLLDSLDTDENGHVPPRSHVAAMAQNALDALPNVPMVHYRLGEALLEKLDEGEIRPGKGGLFEKWLADARVSFPDAEWPFQFYAKALGIQGRYLEAGIAWRDAISKDPFDYRNYLGKASADEALGDYHTAYGHLRRAARLAPNVQNVYHRMAENALHRESYDEALLYSRTAVSFEGDHSDSVQLCHITALELTGNSKHAHKELERIVAKEAPNPGAVQRLARRHCHLGQFDKALELFKRNVERLPGVPLAWLDGASTSHWLGDQDQALQMAFEGLQRCGIDSDLIQLASSVITLSLDETKQTEAVEYAFKLLGSKPNELEVLISGLFSVSNPKLAMGILDHIANENKEDINLRWMRYRILSNSPGTSIDYEAHLGKLLEGIHQDAPGFVFPAVLLAHLYIGTRDYSRALNILNATDDQRAPGLVWFLSAKALDQINDSKTAAALRERMTQLPHHLYSKDADFLCSYGQAELALELIGEIEHLVQDRDAVTLGIQKCRCYYALKQYDAAYEEMGRIETNHNNEFDEQLRISILAAIAQTPEQWGRLIKCLEHVIDEILSNSRDGRDVWPYQGQLAGVHMAQGNHALRAKLFECAANHIGAIEALVKIETRISHPMGIEDMKHLTAIAPGAAQRLKMELL